MSNPTKKEHIIMNTKCFKIPGTEDLYITDIRCLIVDKNGRDLKYKEVDDCYYISLYGQLGWYNKLWLHHVSKLGLDIPNSYNLVQFVPMINGYRKEFQYSVVFNKPIYYDSEKKYRIVPDYPSVAISKNGECVKVINGTNIHITIPKNNKWYPSINIWDTLTQSYISVLVHRLVAMAWCNNPQPGLYTIVNHKDGNKKNFSMYNLEWTDARGNNLHAVENNLTKTNVRCFIRDIYTYEVKEFASLEQVTKFLKIKRRDTRRMQAYLANRVYLDKYELRVAGDTRPWVYDGTEMNIKESRYIITVTEDDGVVKKFNGLVCFIKYYKLWNMSSNVIVLTNALKKQHPNYKIEVEDQYGQKEFQVRNIETGEVKEFNSRREAALYIGTNSDQIHSALLSNGSQNLKGYQLRYLSDEPWVEPSTIDRSAVSLKVTNIKTGEVTRYASLREANRAIKYDKKKLKRMLRKRLKEDIYIVERET